MDFWAYLDRVCQRMPANRSVDIQVAIAHVDEISEENTAPIAQLKDPFGSGGLSHLDDVTSASKFFVLELGFRNF